MEILILGIIAALIIEAIMFAAAMAWSMWGPLPLLPRAKWGPLP